MTGSQHLSGARILQESQTIRPRLQSIEMKRQQPNTTEHPIKYAQVHFIFNLKKKNIYIYKFI